MGSMERFDFDEVEGLRVGRFGAKLNTTCILYRIEETIIDTGPANQWAKVLYFLKERDVHSVLLTHHHEDHSGNARRLNRKLNADIFSHSHGQEILKKGFSVPLYRRLVWGKPGKVETLPMPEKIKAGPLVLDVIHCPGHAPDMACFLEAQRGWLFTGDMYISGRPRFLRSDEDPNEQIKSLTHLLTLQFDTLLCSHRGIVLDGYTAMREKLKYLVTLREQVYYYLDKGDSHKQITRRMLGREEWTAHISGGEFSKRNFVKAFAADRRKGHMSH